MKFLYECTAGVRGKIESTTVFYAKFLKNTVNIG
jgi:hypothetical protein